MNKYLKNAWDMEFNALSETLTIKQCDGAKTPICKVLTPEKWLESTAFTNNAVAKAKAIALLPDIYKASKSLIMRLEKDGGKLKKSKSFIELKRIVDELSK
jgi:hypothetical protein